MQLKDMSILFFLASFGGYSRFKLIFAPKDNTPPSEHNHCHPQRNKTTTAKKLSPRLGIDKGSLLGQAQVMM